MTPELTTFEDKRSSSEIESEIRRTRGRMDSTLDALGDRLTARSLMNSALDWWDSPNEGNQGSAAVRKAAGTIANQARRHPMPAILIGAGVAWLISEKANDNDEPIRRTKRVTGRGRSGYASVDDIGAEDPEGDLKDADSTIARVREKTHQIGDKIHDAKGRLEERTHEALDRSKAAVREVGQDLKDGYHTAEKKFAVACDEYPLAVGVGFAALGALAGLIIPRTRGEDELMGERSDQLMDETKEKAGEFLETGKDVATQVLETVKEKADEQGLTASAVSDTISDLGNRGGQVLQAAREEVVHVAAERGITPPPKSPGGDAQPAPRSLAPS